MNIAINELSEKYVLQLQKNKFLKTIKYDVAVSSIKKAIQETAEVTKKDIEATTKKEIEAAIEPLKSKIADRDSFIYEQTQEVQSLREDNKNLKEEKKLLNENNEVLKRSVAELQVQLDKFKGIVKEAYKHGIIPEFMEQKKGIANILSSLLLHKEPQKPAILTDPEKIPETVLPVKRKAETKKPIQSVRKEKISKQKTENQVCKVNKNIIAQIERERANQRLDKERMDKASLLIKELMQDAPQETKYSTVRNQFEKTMDKYLRTARDFVSSGYKSEKDGCGIIRVWTDENGRVVLKEKGINFHDKFNPYNYQIFNSDGSSIEIHDMNSDSYITFYDTNNKKFLRISYYGEQYGIVISDKNGRTMVSERVCDGSVKSLDVSFNEVKPIPSIENDAPMNNYVQGLIQKAKQNCTSQQNEFKDTTNVDYFNADKKRTVHEYYVNKHKVYTYLFNPEKDSPEKLISSADFGVHAKHDPKTNRWIQYRTKGITGIDKRRDGSNLNNFSINFYKSTENEHFEWQSLYDENYNLDKDSFLQKPVYEKRNYGIASHPLTKAFSFHDLSKQNIKPWDFSILKPYIK